MENYEKTLTTEKPRPTAEDFLRDKYKLVDFHNLHINGKSWLELMQEFSDAVLLRENIFHRNIFNNMTKNTDEIVIKCNKQYYAWQKEKEEFLKGKYLCSEHSHTYYDCEICGCPKCNTERAVTPKIIS